MLEHLAAAYAAAGMTYRDIDPESIPRDTRLVEAPIDNSDEPSLAERRNA